MKIHFSNILFFVLGILFALATDLTYNIYPYEKCLSHLQVEDERLNQKILYIEKIQSDLVQISEVQDKLYTEYDLRLSKLEGKK